MKKYFLIVIAILVLKSSSGQKPLINDDFVKPSADKMLFIYGGGLSKAFIKYVASLTNKPDPKVCYIATASGDNPNFINLWYNLCEELPLKPYVLRTFIGSLSTPKTFEESIMSMDAIIVGGGNTLNMLAIWKAQGIDTILRKAYEKGIILGGGSAGSLCWFTGGYTDSRPKELSLVEGLGFLNFSNCPHYHTEPTRRPLYHQAILNNKLKTGYACDDLAGLLFVNGVVNKSVSLNAENNNYLVSLVDGKIKEELLPAEIIK
jgi:peptidase E